MPVGRSGADVVSGLAPAFAPAFALPFAELGAHVRHGVTDRALATRGVDPLEVREHVLAAE